MTLQSPAHQCSITLLLLLLLPPLLPSDNEMQHSVSRGRCVIAQGQQQHLTAASARMCAFLCSQLRPCISWSYRTGICNVSDSVQRDLTNDTDCELWSALHQLSRVAFWPMSNMSRTRNVASSTGYLDLHENRPMQYVDDAVNFTGQFDVDERYNIDQLTSHCLTSFTMSLWLKVTNSSRGPMPVLEGFDSYYATQLWLYPQVTNVLFVVRSLGSAETRLTMVESLVPDNVWIHITAVYDRKTPSAKIFLNATRIFNTTVTAASVTPCVNFGSSVKIGAVTRSASHNRVFQGLMKCFGISERALSDGEVTQLSQLCSVSNSP